MKFATDIFPKGTWPGQKTDGAYLNSELASNLDVLAKRIVDDMHFMIIISGNDMVGNGKSTFATHVATYLIWKINQLHNLKNEFTADYVTFKGGDLVKRSFKKPKYCVNLLDESDDLKAHSMKDTSQKLKKYFRKCRQLNQILILITPSFFELPKFYAMSRSHALIDVKFHDDFQRGEFAFYGMTAKKSLYIRGKRDWNYAVQRPDFTGAFTKGYMFMPDLEKNVEIYKKLKYDDMMDDSDDDEKETPAKIERRISADLFHRVYNNMPDKTIKELSKIFGISNRTGDRYLALSRESLDRFESQKASRPASRDQYNKILIERDEFLKQNGKKEDKTTEEDD